MNYCPCGVVTGFLKTEGPQGTLQKQEEETNTLKLITPSFFHYKNRFWRLQISFYSFSNLEDALWGNMEIFLRLCQKSTACYNVSTLHW